MTAKYSIPSYRITLVRDGSCSSAERPQMRSSQTSATVLQHYLSDVDREHFVILLLNQKREIIGIHTVSIGSLSAAVVHPREVFKAAIVGNAAAIICGHNHPSGDAQPSQEDRAMTARLVAAGKVLGIEVLDHVIIGEGSHFSFADNGCL